jgi:tetratricopeptide (TPR) repeat protein
VRLGEALLERGMKSDALELGRQLLPEHAEDARAYWLLARALQASGQLKEADGAYHKAVSLDPWLVGAYQGLAALAQAQGDTTTAIALWLRLSGLYPEALEPRRGLMQAYLTSGKAARAYAVLEGLAERDRESALGWHWRGAILASLGCPEQAVAAYRKSLALGLAEADWAWAGIASAMADMGRLPEAIKAYQTASEANPAMHEWRYRLAVQLKDGGRPAEALKITEDLIKRFPEAAQHWRQHGFVLAVLGRPNEAIPAMEHSLQVDARQAKVWAALVETYQTVGRRKDALEAYRRLKEVDGKLADETYRSSILPFEEERR